MRRTPYIMPGFSRFQELPLLGNALGAALGSKHNLEVSSLLAVATGMPNVQMSADQAGSAQCPTVVRSTCGMAVPSCSIGEHNRDFAVKKSFILSQEAATKLQQIGVE